MAAPFRGACDANSLGAASAFCSAGHTWTHTCGKTSSSDRIVVDHHGLNAVSERAVDESPPLSSMAGDDHFLLGPNLKPVGSAICKLSVSDNKRARGSSSATLQDVLLCERFGQHFAELLLK